MKADVVSGKLKNAVGFSVASFKNDSKGGASSFGQAFVRAEEFELRHKKITRLVYIQSYIVAVLLVAIFLCIPIAQPIYTYIAARPDGKKMAMASMLVPNLTDQAVLSWSAKSITGLMTFGFGDVDKRIFSQKQKFTPKGWSGFVQGFLDQGVWEAFKSNQLVLTTAPADAPILVRKGPDVDGEYKWVVEMPIIMKYSTNSLKSTTTRVIVRLVLMRVPLDQNPDGIGIESWIVS